MLKEPRPGRVKTRLGAEIGMDRAAWWYRHTCTRLLRRLRDPRWRLVLAVAPQTALGSRVWPADLARVPQGRGDLGRRMLRLLQTAGPAGRDGPVCLIGSDIPDIARPHIARAFAALGAHDAVFGPAEDGGFWLVGAKHPARLPCDSFDGARWSSRHALADSLSSLPGLSVALTDRLHDVDTAADLR
ncbi:TIGR04282 family arsenosugar biosynthesis glycosyltransferase [Pseudodonghicola flavimaris]|uniref:TIGR04282 family arsenosugar biosynthesis glycosyltransferase n=1 Tax=Pseudodonghicola flavimaris TaxID=3050036 RepID=A0ABT7EZP2_9RHOB|nr:TIGR04282 family arsenosugar biosynthesis glycosyltransferase [Pseudodonghicola flavimaris]MDK3017720.1 TIGR04282 family arsenosugar biosynthesis glycosyltransferase [Pseudodonghicola flavimaris]